MKTGGIMWTSPAIPVPIETPEDADGTEEDPIPWGEASLTESWFDSFYGYATGKWKLLVPDGGEPFSQSLRRCPNYQAQGMSCHFESDAAHERGR
jgi:hypothetical protein